MPKTRIWLHALNSAGQHKLVLSPDTDVYYIGLPIIAMTSLHVIVQLKVGCHGPRMCTEIYCSANLTLNLRVDSEYVVA